MKNFWLVLLLSYSCSMVNAQSDSRDPIISLGYFAPYGIQVGARIGTEIPINSWGNQQQTNGNYFAIRPQLSYFTRLRFHHNVMLEADFAYTIRKEGKRSYWTPSIALGYLFSRERIEGSIDLSNGEINNTVESVHFFLPTLNIEVGRAPTEKVGYFFKGSYGRRISGQRLDNAYFGAELGLKFLLKK